MKRNTLIPILILVLALPLIAAPAVVRDGFGSSGTWTAAYGSWSPAMGRMVQRDAETGLAKLNVRVPQSGRMRYDFTVRYAGKGVEDMRGGLGIQIFVDKAHNGMSWGNGKSYLLWVNYDPNPSYGEAGFRGQVYRSASNSVMTLDSRYDVALDPRVLTRDALDLTIPVSLIVDGDTGAVTLEDPSSGKWYTFPLPQAPGRGEYISFPTNSIAVSFGDLSVTRLD